MDNMLDDYHRNMFGQDGNEYMDFSEGYKDFLYEEENMEEGIGALGTVLICIFSLAFVYIIYKTIINLI